MVLLYIGLYLLTGLITIFSVSFCHLYKAEKDGYEALKWWNENSHLLAKEITVKSYILGLMIWPIRLYYFTFKLVPILMEHYELKSK